MYRLLTVALFLGAVAPGGLADTAVLTKDEATGALRQAVTFFREEVSREGGYLWRYSADLSRREGEGRASPSMVWVQPPGTPTVGAALLTAYERTKDTFYLDAAVETATALVRGQLVSGGWGYRIEFDPEKRDRKYAYRVAPCNPKGDKVATLDDNTTQAALRYLMRVDRVLEFKNTAIREAVMFALDRLLEAQYPIGAWPQRFTSPPDPEKYPVKKASYPETWSRTYPSKNYMGYYTFNDNTIADMIETMFDAADTYNDARCRAAAEKAGEFILLAQMPDPQPAWAQQYDAEMHPAWARKFEPPAVTGGESHGVMRSALHMYRETADRRYLEAVDRAVAYLKASRLPDGRLARFYELETNTPLYFTIDYQLTYSSDDMPTHYGFIVGSGLDAIEAESKALAAMDPTKLKAPIKKPTYRTSPALEKRARTVVDALDERGAWVEDGRLRYHGADDPARRIIDSQTFVRNVHTLSEFVAACP